MADRKVTTMVTRTVEVEFNQDAVRELLRKECAAPPSAMGDIDSWGDAKVTWSTTEQAP